ncbi:MAG TPA: hypothetical protein PLV01_05200 [Candidatus Kapabacteria bacterium]|nr:hypothetical protein [Candidatus Kapabacteria bacterium]
MPCSSSNEVYRDELLTDVSVRSLRYASLLCDLMLRYSATLDFPLVE